ncbi:TPA: hypothetical protein ACLA84_000694, partial [Neisseria meningitidis]
LLIPRYRCRLNLQTAFLIYLPLTNAGRAWKYPNRHSRYTVILKSVIPDNTAISKFVIPAQAGIQTSDAAGIYRK